MIIDWASKIENLKEFYASSVSESTESTASLPGCGARAGRTASQFDRNVSATLCFQNEFSMRSFIDSPCEN
jgi:hypothetical protein